MNSGVKSRVFVSYKRNSDPDEKVALQVYESLSRQHDVFIDQTMLVGTRWAQRIESELRRSDFLIPLISSQSVNSEMVVAEIEMAHGLSKEQEGRPAILPVRLASIEPLQYPLSAYLGSIQWAFWGGPDDTKRVIEDLKKAIDYGRLVPDRAHDQATEPTETATFPQPSPLAQPVSVEAPGDGGPDSIFYIQRTSDLIAKQTIEGQGRTLIIKGSAKMGKSSLLFRTTEAAIQAGKKVVFLDFHLIGKPALADSDLFFRQFCSWITDELEMEDKVDEYWNTPLGNSQRCTRYIARYILKELGKPLVLAMDEVDSILDSSFRTDFFGMLRTWHNNRATLPIWKTLDLVLATSGEPYQLIDNLNQSPFNVGEVVELADFTSAEISQLVNRHRLSEFDADSEIKLRELLGGHPYLTRQALFLLATQRIDLKDLFNHATDEFGPFGDHLRYQLFWLHGKKDLLAGLREVIRTNMCQDALIFFRLRAAGLVRRQGDRVVPRCDLYAQYFRERLSA